MVYCGSGIRLVLAMFRSMLEGLLRMYQLTCKEFITIQGFWDYAFFPPANDILFHGELCAQNPELCADNANCAIFFSEKLNAFCTKVVAICSAPSCFGRHGE